jgi:GTP-binding protein
VVRQELDLHGHGLANKPEIVAVSKAELTGSEVVQQRLADELAREVLAVSAVTGQGLAQLVGNIVEKLKYNEVVDGGDLGRGTPESDQQESSGS